MKLSIKQLSTIRLALTGWAARCDGEARLQERLGAEMPDMAARAAANADASRQMAIEARATLQALDAEWKA